MPSPPACAPPEPDRALLVRFERGEERVELGLGRAHRVLGPGQAPEPRAARSPAPGRGKPPAGLVAAAAPAHGHRLVGPRDVDRGLLESVHGPDRDHGRVLRRLAVRARELAGPALDVLLRAAAL